MKYIGIGMMWFGYAGVVTALSFSKIHPGDLAIAVVIIGVALSIASSRVARWSSNSKEGVHGD